jgi:epoxyqueuosine reductase
VNRQTSQEVCPWNVTFARALPDGSPFAPRDFLAGKDATTLARDVLALDDEAFRAAFSKSPMKREKLAGLQRNARVVLANVASMPRREGLHDCGAVAPAPSLGSTD